MNIYFSSENKIRHVAFKDYHTIDNRNVTLHEKLKHTPPMKDEALLINSEV